MHQKTVLDNGVRLLTASMPHTRSVSICIYVGSGSRYEDDEHAGISHFLEHMLFKGTPRRPSAAEITGAIEQVGGLMNGSTDREITAYWCKVATPHFQSALDVLVDMVRNPLMDSEEVEKERSVIQEELAMSNDYPGYRVEMLTDQMLWPDHPMGRDVGGSKETVNGITREMLTDWFQRQYGASNVVISIAGSLSNEEMLDAVTPMVKDWPSGSPLGWEPAGNGSRQEPQARMEYRKTEQAHLALSLPGISTRHPQRYPMDMMNAVMGEGMSSRLFLEVREKRGLAYDIHSSASHFRDTGSITIYFGVDPKKARYAIETTIEELHRIKEDIPDEDLHRARELAKGRLLLRMEDTRAVAAWAGAQELLHDEVLTVDQVVERVDGVTTEDVKQAANQFLAREKLNLAVVGPYRSDKQFQNVIKM